MSASPSVIVVGAGWAGLAAAVELAAAGCRVRVLESAPQAGGRARSLTWQGDRIDNGQHLMIGAYSATLEMLARIGADTSRCLQRLPLFVEVPGHMSLRLARLPAPFHLAVGLLLASGPDWREKLSAARFIGDLRRRRFMLPADSTVAQWLDDNAQRGTLRKHLWEPLCLAALNTAPHQASAQVFANVLRDTLGSTRAATDLLLPMTDLSALFAEPATQFLVDRGSTLHCRSRVLSIAREGGSWRATSAQESFVAEHLVLATAPQHVAALLDGVSAEPAALALRAQLLAFEYEPIATAYLQYAATRRLTLPLLAFNDGVAQWSFDRGQLGGRPGLIAHVLSARGKWQEFGNEELVAILHDATANGFAPGAGAGEPPQSWQVIREQRATFSCRPGLRRPPTATGLPHLWLAGDYVASDYPGTLEAAVRSGKNAAALILGERG